MTTLISRDPFARTELHRARVTEDYPGILHCLWCGNVKTTPKGNRFLFQYSQESDGGTKNTIPGLFCSIEQLDRREWLDGGDSVLVDDLRLAEVHYAFL